MLREDWRDAEQILAKSGKEFYAEPPRWRSEAELRLEFAAYCCAEHWKGIQRRNALENAVLRAVLWFLAAVNVAMWIGLASFFFTH